MLLVSPLRKAILFVRGLVQRWVDGVFLFPDITATFKASVEQIAFGQWEGCSPPISLNAHLQTLIGCVAILAQVARWIDSKSLSRKEHFTFRLAYFTLA